MCGIFGVISPTSVDIEKLKFLAEHARQSGSDSSGLIIESSVGYNIYRADFDIKKLLSKVKFQHTKVALDHTTIITNGLSDNQLVIRNGICVIRNGTIVNDNTVWSMIGKERFHEIDTEVIAAITEKHLEEIGQIEGVLTW